jgi:hypothetical protein
MLADQADGTQSQEVSDLDPAAMLKLVAVMVDLVAKTLVFRRN